MGRATDLTVWTSSKVFCSRGDGSVPLKLEKTLRPALHTKLIHGICMNSSDPQLRGFAIAVAASRRVCVGYGMQTDVDMHRSQEQVKGASQLPNAAVVAFHRQDS